MVDKLIKTKSPDKIHHEISDMLSKGVSYIDALVLYSERERIEIESLAEIIKKSTIFKEKIRLEAVEKRLVKPDEKYSKLC